MENNQDRDDAGRILKVSPDSLEYYSFPHTFGNTAGPFGGIGGATITNFQLDAYVDLVTGNAALFCQNRFWKRVYNFQRPAFTWTQKKND